MVKFTHEDSEQEFEVSEATLGDCRYLHVEDLGWWERDPEPADGDDLFYEIDEPARPTNSVRISRPEGVEPYVDGGVLEDEDVEDEDDEE